jgi:hypothetical protein
VPRTPPEQIEFRYDEWEPVLERMNELSREGTGWINLFPETVDEEIDRPPSGSSVFGTLFRNQAPEVPLGTWTARTDKAPASVGISHAVRQKVAPTLVQAGIVAPTTWRLVQDNARRGIVVRVPDDEQPEQVLSWLMSAIDELCPVQITGQWLAEIHR